MLGRHTTDGRFEHEISANFVSKDYAKKNLQKVKSLNRQPSIEDIEDGEIVEVPIVDGVERYLRKGKTIYKQTWEKVG